MTKATFLLFNTERLIDLSEEYFTTILLSSLTTCVQQILRKRQTKGKLKHYFKNNNNTYEPKRRAKHVSTCSPIHAALISLCKGKVQKLFESLRCLLLLQSWPKGFGTPPLFHLVFVWNLRLTCDTHS